MSAFQTSPKRFGKGILLFAKCSCLIFLLMLANMHTGSAQTATAAGGDWNLGSTWVGGVVPVAGGNITIPIGSAVNVNITTPIVNNVTVNGSLVIMNSITSKLNYNGNMVVAGTLTNNGGIEQHTNGRAFNLTGIGTYVHNPNNNTLTDETIFSKSVESFSTTSLLHIQKWFDLGLPLGDPTRVTGNFGHVTLSLSDTLPWEQDGQFMTPAIVKRIYGTLTVTSGAVSMDNGTGNTTDLYLNDVIINGTGRIIFSSGTNRSLLLITNNFTDVSTNTKPTILQDQCYGLTIWTCNGNATLGHTFYGISGTGNNVGGDLRININGSLSMTGGTINLVRQATAPLTLTVSINTTISGAGTIVNFVEGNSGNMTFTTNNLNILGGTNSFVGGNTFFPYTGIATININNDFNIGTAASSNLLVNAATNTNKVRIYVGHDFNVAAVNANTILARNRAALTLYVANNFTQSAGKFTGQLDTLNNSIDSLYVGGSFLYNNPTLADYFRFNYGSGNTYIRIIGAFTLTNSSITAGNGFVGIYGGAGRLFFNAGSYSQANGRFTGIYGYRPNIQTASAAFNVVLNYGIAGGFFRVIENKVNATTGSVTFATGNMNYTGGNFGVFYAVHIADSTLNFSVVGLFQITFPAAATPQDSFVFICQTSLGADISELKLNVNVGGNFNITGGTGKFISSLANARETINITGDLNFSGGVNSFNSFPNSGRPNPHPVTINIGANLSCNGGTTYLSAHDDSLRVTVNGNFTIGIGELTVQAGYGSGIMNVLGGYTQTGGTFFLHKNSTTAGSRVVTVTINSNGDAVGNFSQTAGIINFDNNTTSVGNTLTIKSPSVTLGGTGSITMANAGTNPISGQIIYSLAGAIILNRTATTHNIHGINQVVATGTFMMLDLASQNMQVSSYMSPVFTGLNVQSGAVLDIRDKQIVSNALQPNAGIFILGRLRISRAQGLYDGTTNAAISSLGGMNFVLTMPSTVEYYGNNNQVITGIGVGLATTTNQKYGILEINFTGTPDVEFVYPTNIPDSRSVFVRYNLALTNGELNLDNDHDPVSGGRSIIIERDSTVGITRTNGYIRSEVQDSSASVIWKINAKGGPHVFPFAYSSAPTDYIPFTFQLPAGSPSVDTVIVSTYRTSAQNLPLQPRVLHVNGLSGSDNSSQTVDRFWYVETTGTVPSANMTFVCTSSEMSGILQPRAQRWIMVASGWEYPYQGTQSNPVSGTQVIGATSFEQNWWTLAGLSNPLPISLLEFKGACESDEVKLHWTTGSEQGNDFFTVLRSRDGFSYEAIGTLPGSGTVSTPVAYNFDDKFAPQGLNYYKLRQTDYDGKTSEFGPIVVESCQPLTHFDVTVIPNTPNSTDVVLSLIEPGKYRFVLYTLEGKPVYTAVRTFETSGMNVTTLDHGTLSSAVYILRIEGNSDAVSKKVLLGLRK
jgi:hypothetical protein